MTRHRHRQVFGAAGGRPSSSAPCPWNQAPQGHAVRRDLQAHAPKLHTSSSKQRHTVASRAAPHGCTHRAHATRRDLQVHPRVAALAGHALRERAQRHEPHCKPRMARARVQLVQHIITAVQQARAGQPALQCMREEVERCGVEGDPWADVVC